MPNGRDFCCLIPELVVMGLAGSFILRVLLWNFPSCLVKSELLCIKNMNRIKNINRNINETYGGKSLQNINHLHAQKLSDYLDKMLMPPCKWKRKHSEMPKSILCLISGIIIMSVSAVELKWTQETYNVLESPAVLPIAVKYSLQVWHLNSDLHQSRLTCQMSDDPRTRQYIHNHSFQWSVSFGFKIPSTTAYFIYMLNGYRA